MTNLRPVKIEYDNPIEIKIISKLSNDKPIRMTARMLRTGNVKCLIVDTVFRNSLLENYSNDNYVGKCFWVKKLKPGAGTNYADFDVKEIEPGDEVAEKIARWESIDSVQPVDMQSKHGRNWFPTPEEYKVLRNVPEDFNKWYSKYLQRKLWKTTIKPRIFRRYQNQCCRCGGDARIVHHMSYDYDVILGRRDDELIAICDGCHEFIHFDEHGNKRSRAETDRLARQTNDIETCAPPKIDGRRRFPPNQQWKRMNSVQRREYDRAWCLRKMQRWTPQQIENNRNQLRTIWGLADVEINLEIQKSQSRLEKHVRRRGTEA